MRARGKVQSKTPDSRLRGNDDSFVGTLTQLGNGYYK